MKVLFVCPFVPWPLDSGGRIRTWHLSRAAAAHVELELWVVREPAASDASVAKLHELGVPVRVFPRGGADPLARWTRPKIERWFASPALVAALRDRLAADPPGLVHLDELLLARALPRVVPSGIAVAQHHHKIDTVLAERLARGLDPARRFDLWKLRRLEREAAGRTRAHITCSAEDGALLRRRYPWLETWDVPSGFDPGAFAPGTAAERESDRLVFVGSMDYPPNVDAVVRFARECWPALRARRPALRLDVVGRDPAPEVLALAGEGIAVHGAVPDVRPWMRRAAAMVVPLRIGGGTRLKIVEALALGTPVVSTRVGAEGLGLEDGEHLRLADGAEETVRATCELLEDPGGAARLGNRGRAFVESRYRWDALGERLARAWKDIASCEGTPAPSGSRPAPSPAPPRATRRPPTG